jgi:hypothetical protein
VYRFFLLQAFLFRDQGLSFFKLEFVFGLCPLGFDDLYGYQGKHSKIENRADAAAGVLAAFLS